MNHFLEITGYLRSCLCLFRDMYKKPPYEPDERTVEETLSTIDERMEEILLVESLNRDEVEAMISLGDALDRLFLCNLSNEAFQPARDIASAIWKSPHVRRYF